MPKGSSREPGGSAAGRLSRELVIETALGQIDRSGAQGLSMRSLAQDLGVESMSLYRYVHGREDLLEGVIALLLGQLTSDLDEELAEHWQGFLQDLAHKGASDRDRSSAGVSVGGDPASRGALAETSAS